MIRTLLALGMVATLAACGGEDQDFDDFETMPAETAPVQEQPMMTDTLMMDTMWHDTMDGMDMDTMGGM